ncbi:Asp-tRNA(Asn)/Glu-tRNA(Gln) amidotransferase subunit GatB [Patescibacteria group bacterium]|nr:Asp-tRNA(Asn)/Glu-tRNA(Gln) amidotransferase subunit GatB [Patescibacteria group bacterium]MBU1499905.1 Asp-tRNA(Asn)/Glu-tRNA(Gln) amidotransferase subunit GatB [Patescibacteria group bacterium]
MNQLISVIGLEIHVELKTKSKMFCGCPADHFGEKPNTQTCPVCLALPGALPVSNKKAIDWTIMIGLALNCRVNLESTFDRKHYFYPDLPKGYQISQYDDPFCFSGHLLLASGKKIRINRVHLEEDTAKMQHKTINGKKLTLVDFNRSGVPLVEIVTEPDVTSGAEAKEFLKKLRDILRHLQVSDCDMEKGSMRLEPNISWSESVNNLADYKVEIKNLNSFRFTETAIDYELKRQKEILDRGETPIQETRGYKPQQKITFSQRIKETAADYRYFPEPDIPPIVLTLDYVEKLRAKLPKLPEAEINELIKDFHLNIYTSQLLVKDASKLAYFKKYLTVIDPVKLANMIINKKIDLDKPPQLKTITQVVAPKIIEQVLKENAGAVAKYQAGKTSVLGFLVGQVMRLTHGKVNPQQAQIKLLERL